jgi:hypothetical protein
VAVSNPSFQRRHLTSPCRDRATHRSCCVDAHTIMSIQDDPALSHLTILQGKGHVKYGSAGWFLGHSSGEADDCRDEKATARPANGRDLLFCRYSEDSISQTKYSKCRSRAGIAFSLHLLTKFPAPSFCIHGFTPEQCSGFYSVRFCLTKRLGRNRQLPVVLRWSQTNCFPSMLASLPRTFAPTTDYMGALSHLVQTLLSRRDSS